jgi:6-phosphogluconolactonase
MSFLRAACAALISRNCSPRILAAVTVVLAGFFASCGGGNTIRTGPNHRAYVTLPTTGNVLELNINGTNGEITAGTQTPQVGGTSPTGIALLPNKAFLYTANSRANTISVFRVASDGTLALSGAPAPAGSGPNGMVIDPSGKYLLVTNNFDNDISVFSIDSGTGALSEIAGSPFFANQSPTQIQISHSGKFVYVTNPGIGTVTGFSMSNGVLTQVPGSPFSSGAQGGAAALTVDGSDRFLYVANPSAVNPPPNSITVGNITGFSIDPNTGSLTTILGSPFSSVDGTGPSAVTLDPSGRFLYAVTPGSSFSIWCFLITPENGQLTEVLGSPFSLAAGGQFALIDPSGSFFYIGSQVAKGIESYTLNPSTGVPTLITNSPFTTVSVPGAMVFSE